MLKFLLAVVCLCFSLASDFDTNVNSTQYNKGNSVGSVNIFTPTTIKNQPDINITIGKSVSGATGNVGNIILTPGKGSGSGDGYVSINGSLRVVTMSVSYISSSLTVNAIVINGTSNTIAPINVYSTSTVNTELMDLTTSLNNFAEITILNTSGGNNAQSGFNAQGNNGTATTNFSFFGRNNSGYSNVATWNIGLANETQVLGLGGNLDLGSDQAIKMYAGGTSENKIVMVVTPSLVTVYGTVSASALRVNDTVTANKLVANNTAIVGSPAVLRGLTVQGAGANGIVRVERSNGSAQFEMANYSARTTGNLVGNVLYTGKNDAGTIVEGLAQIGGIDEGTDAKTGINFQTGSNGGTAERMRIDNAGNVGIGTTAPSTKLEVAGTVSASALQVNGDISFSTLSPKIGIGVGGLGIYDNPKTTLLVSMNNGNGKVTFPYSAGVEVNGTVSMNYTIGSGGTVTPSAVEGATWYNRTSKKMNYYNGTTWVSF